MKETRSEKLFLAFTGVCALLTAIGSLVYLMIALSSLIMIQPAFGQSTAAVRLESGIAKEDVDGDLKSAMDVYQKIAAERSAPRDVRSKALLRLAGCYEKLGGQARQVYEQVVRDFADQPAATQARSRLASLVKLEHPAPPPTMTLRQIKSSGLGRMGLGEDTDGERAVYMDPSNSLFYGDLAGHTKRLIFKAQPDDGLRWYPSKDFSMVTLFFREKLNRPATLAVVKTDGTGYRELVRVDPGESTPGERWVCCTWSWDNRYVLFAPGQTRGQHLMVVPVADGRRRELVSLETGRFAKAVFSADRRFVAYEVWTTHGGSDSSRIFITPVQGGEPRLVYESDARTELDTPVLLDWSADGHHLAITDVRKGKKGLFLLPLKEGDAVGVPVLVRAGHIERGFMTAAGTLVFQAPKPGGVYNVSLASLDPDGRLGTWRRLDIRGDNLHVNPWPSFSPEGARVAYMSQELEGTGGAALVLQDLSSGKEKIVHRSLDGELACQYANHHAKIFCADDKPGGKTDLISVAESGEVERLGSLEGLALLSNVSQDDGDLYLNKYAGDNMDIGELVRWNIATRQETALGKASDEEMIFPSFDDRLLLRFAGTELSVRPLSGGEWRTLTSLAKPVASRAVTTPDGRWVLYSAQDPAGKLSLFRAPVAGGQPQRLGNLPENTGWGTLHISHDGRQILSATTVPGDDLFVLENFVPSAKR